MSDTNAFALKNSGLNTFLFAEVGTELNGSTLTILSVLARLGKDPWAEAGRWAKLPKAAVIDCLAASMAQMPLSPQAIRDIPQTAARLILLLPKQAMGSPADQIVMPSLGRLPRGVTLLLVAAALAAGLAVSIFATPAVNAPLAPVEQNIPLRK